MSPPMKSSGDALPNLVRCSVVQLPNKQFLAEYLTPLSWLNQDVQMQSAGYVHQV